MRIQLSTDYSLRLLLYLGLKTRQSSVKEVAAAYGISFHHLNKVAHELMRQGYIRGKKGRGGGIELAKDPRTIRLGDFIQRRESESLLLECFDAHTNTCPLIGVCRLQKELAKAQKSFYDSLNGSTLADLIVSSPKDPRKIRLGIS